MELNEQNFQSEVENDDVIVLVDFFAPWCGPCKMIAPIIEELAQEYKDNSRVKIGKLNVDENQAIAEKYNVMGVPTLILFKGGKVIEQIVGIRPKEDLAELIKANI